MHIHVYICIYVCISGDKHMHVDNIHKHANAYMYSQHVCDFRLQLLPIQLCLMFVQLPPYLTVYCLQGVFLACSLCRCKASR